MNDLISRQAAIDACLNGWNKDYKEIVKEIRALPPVIPQPTTGRWMPIEYDGYADGYPVWDKWECSECGWEHSGDKESLTAFCPNCGAKMESEDKK